MGAGFARQISVGEAGCPVGAARSTHRPGGSGFRRGVEALGHVEGPPHMPPPSAITVTDDSWPDEIHLGKLRDPAVVVAVLQLLIRMQQWVHRRVETVAFCDGTTITRRVSVDFTVPAQAPAVRLAAGAAPFYLLPWRCCAKTASAATPQPTATATSGRCSARRVTRGCVVAIMSPHASPGAA